jgi:1-deoxy-D-xylulose 5-phosphate reductoisomerase
VAVYAFLRSKIAFTAIAEVIEQTLSEVEVLPVGHFSDLYSADAAAREYAGRLIEGVVA